MPNSPTPPEKKKDPFYKYILKQTLEASGWGSQVRAVKSRDPKKIGKSIGTKVFDIASFKIFQVSVLALFVLGIGAGAPLPVLAIEIGAVNALYTYGKFYLLERFSGPQEQRKKTKILSKDRAVKAGIAFTLGSTIGGATGWAERSGHLAPVLEPAGKIFGMGKGFLSRAFHSAVSTLPFSVPGNTPGMMPAPQPSV